jgi:hypothetical protein
MNYSFFKKPSVVAIVLIAIFSFTGFAYAKKAKHILTTDTTESVKVKEDLAVEAKETQISQETADVATENVQLQPITLMQEDTPVEKPQKNDEKTFDVKRKTAADLNVKIDTADSKTTASTSTYPVHSNITATVFWAGEDAGDDNGDISNLPSAWDEEWVKHFGGVDKPNKRSGNLPSGFTPKENPFYFALPYNDFDENGKRKKEIGSLVPWAGRVAWKDNESVLKNQWIKTTKNGKVAYAQWQDVGPFKEDDAAYVFGTAEPKSKTNKHAGLDVSPAVHDILGLKDIDTVDWQFVNPDQVPDGPWKAIVTSSQINWK